MVHLLLGRDVERRRLFLMERTQADVVLATLLQFDKLTDDVKNVAGAADLVYFVLSKSH